MQSSLSVGDEVVLTSGIHGMVRGVDDDVVQVEIASGVTIRVARAAIGIVDPRRLARHRRRARPGRHEES